MYMKPGGGNQMQPYDPSTGRYCCKEGSFSWAYSLSIKRYNLSLKTKKLYKTSKSMPNYKKAITPDEKFTLYSLNKDHYEGKHKALVYERVLGYNLSNFESLKKQICNQVNGGIAKLVSIKMNDYGIAEYNFDIDVKGPNGNTAIVRVKYGIDKGSCKPKMITNYVK